MRHNKHAIFRRKAWEAYIDKQEQTVLPRFVTPPVFVFCWILFALLLGTGAIAWYADVPMYVAGSGILQEQPVSSSTGIHKMMALIFLTVRHPLMIQKGAFIQLQAGKIGPDSSGQVERVEPGLINPQDVSKRYNLSATVASLITHPSMVVLASVAPPLSAHIYEGSVVSAQVPIGTQHLLMLLFESNN